VSQQSFRPGDETLCNVSRSSLGLSTLPPPRTEPGPAKLTVADWIRQKLGFAKQAPPLSPTEETKT